MIRRVTVAAMLSLLLSTAAATGQSDSQRWLTVEVTDQQGRPLSRACVTFVPKEGEIIFRKADGRGRVKLKGAAAAGYRVVVKVEGYEAQKREVAAGGNETVAFALRERRNR